MANKSGLIKHLDGINEYAREPIPKNKLHGVGNFIGMYAGEHVAGTEFVIGPLFILHGVSAVDLFAGLIIGNILAVLSWAFLVAPIATKIRLTLYWQLQKIAGPLLTVGYNIVNALLFCFIAGAMISVSATAVGLPFNMKMPGINDIYPNSIQWVLVVLGVGSVVIAIATLGFEKLAQFAKNAAPWMFLVFVAAAIAVLPKLGVTAPSDFWDVAKNKIWTGVPLQGQSKFTFWHVMFFAWFCNMAVHIGMGDLTVFRYAKKWTYGFTSAFGMFLGHFTAWIASGIICAAAAVVADGTIDMDGASFVAGPIAYKAVGVVGAICVVIAGWTTANPLLYRAGLALQAVTPNWKRWKVTVVAGLITTVAALFPGLMMRLLDFVALYGLILMPIGAIIFIDFWVLKKFNLKENYAEFKNLLFSWPVAASWGLTLLIVMLIPIDIFFKGLPGWFITSFLYVAFSYVQQKMGNKQTPEIA